MIAMIPILLRDRMENYFAGIVDMTLFVTNK
jgi:hypothetical protein